MVLPSKNWCKGSNGPSIRSLEVNEERIRPGHWLGLMCCFLLVLLTLLARWLDGHTAHTKPCAINLQRSSCRSTNHLHVGPVHTDNGH